MAQKTNQAQSKEEKVSAKAARQAQEAVLESLFDDMYRKRWKVYHFNFVRGIFLGFGTAIGGTVVVAIALWILSWFVDWPLVDQVINSLKK